MTIHELRDENGNVIHACATASLPLPKDHWIYQKSPKLDPLPGITTELLKPIRERIKDALKHTIIVCTNNGRDMDFDPDAMCMTLIYTLLQGNKGEDNEG